MAKRIGRLLLCLLALLLLLAAALVIWLTVTEPRPADMEAAAYLPGGEAQALQTGDAVRLLSFNTGYCALGAESDFFMDGGKDVRPADAAVLRENLDGIMSTVLGVGADFCLLQEVDRDSHRSYGMDQGAALLAATGRAGAYAWNYRCAFVPFPLPPIGRVDSGLLTTSRHALLDDAGEAGGTRHALPCPFSWPVRTANLKRCLLVTHTPVAGTDRELVVVNFHLEAYDDGAGKAAQTRALLDLLEAEYAAGNYVVAGGDFNCALPGSLEPRPIRDADKWAPGVLSPADLPDGFVLAYDLAVPSCRLLDAPWDGDNQTYVIDGFLVSDNLRVEAVETLDLGFQYSDHNPVVLDLHLG